MKISSRLLPLALGFVVNVSLASDLGGLVADYREVYSAGRPVHVVEIDNDSLLLTLDDGLYSSGVRYSYRRVVDGAGELRTAGWRIGQELYTPTNINLPPARVGPPARPYAGWLYGGVFHETHLADGTYTRLGIDVGCLGPCAGGEWTQTRFHRLLDQPEPKGWSRQIGTEWGVVLYGEVAPVRWKLTRHMDLTPVLHGRFGNIFTDAGAGATLRFGRLDELPGQRALYGFVRLDTHVVGYDATLQGGYFSDDSPHTGKPERFSGEIELGGVWSEGQYGIRAGIVHRSNEVASLSSSQGEQTFVRLMFVYAPK